MTLEMSGELMVSIYDKKYLSMCQLVLNQEEERFIMCRRYRLCEGVSEKMRRINTTICRLWRVRILAKLSSRLFSQLVVPSISLSHAFSVASFPPAFILTPKSQVEMLTFTTAIYRHWSGKWYLEVKDATLFLGRRQVAKVGGKTGIMDCILDADI